MPTTTINGRNYEEVAVTADASSPLPVKFDGGSVTIDTITVPASVEVNNANDSPVPVSDAGGSLTVDGPLTNSELRASPVSVTGALTDAQLRAVAVPVSGPLTDVQLRATAVPVSGPLTDAQLRAADVPVSGPLTDTELRAAPVPVSGVLTDSELRATPVPAVTTVAARTPTTASVASSAASVTILASNANRKGLMICNVSSGRLYLSFSTPATAVNSFIELSPGGFLLLDQQLIVTNAIYGVWSSVNGTAQVTELV